MLQIVRSRTDGEAGALHAKQFLIIDRDTKYSEPFRRLIRDNGMKVIRLPPMAPNLNAYAERFVRAIKHGCLDRMILVRQASLRHAVDEYMAHYHQERNHQDLGDRLMRATAVAAANDRAIDRHALLGGMLNFYYRQTA